MDSHQITTLDQSSQQGKGPLDSGLFPVESIDTEAYSYNTDVIDDAILRAQGHKAAMPRLFNAASSLGLMFW
jgi:choline transport protein